MSYESREQLERAMRMIAEVDQKAAGWADRFRKLEANFIELKTKSLALVRDALHHAEDVDAERVRAVSLLQRWRFTQHAPACVCKLCAETGAAFPDLPYYPERSVPNG